MAKDALIVKTTPLPQSRISFELEIPSETCKTCVNETISSIKNIYLIEINIDNEHITKVCLEIDNIVIIHNGMSYALFSF